MMIFCPRSRWLQCVFGVILAAVMPSLVFALAPPSNPPKYVVQNWNTENGLPQNSVHTMLQTADGYLWMATENGLARFDGYGYRVFNTESTPRLPGNDIRCMLEDSRHALWVGTASGLVRLQDGVAELYTTQHGLPSNSIRSVMETKNGALWVVTAGGVARLSDGNPSTSNPLFRRLVYGNGPMPLVQKIAQSSGGTLWAATDHGLFEISEKEAPKLLAGTAHENIRALTCDQTSRCVFASDSGTWQVRRGVLTALVGRESMPAGGIHRLLVTSSGIWAATETSVLLLQPSGAITTFRTRAELPGHQVESLFSDRRGAVWIGTDDGAARWWQNGVSTISLGDGTAVSTFFEDRDGDLWLGTDTTGVFELRDRPFDLIGRAQGLDSGMVTTIAEGANGDLWAGTSARGARLIGKDETAVRPTLGLKQGLPSNTVLSIATNPRDRSEVWFGTPDGLGHLQNGHFSVIGTKDGLPDDFIRSLLLARDGAVWIGSQHGVTRWVSGHAKTWTTEQGLGNDLVGAMVEDRAGGIWIGTLHGLARYKDGSMRNYTVSDGLPNDTITALYEGSAGDVWIATNGGGLAVWDGTRIAAIPHSAALPNAVFAILEDGKGYLWISSEYGFDRIALADMAAYRVGRTHTLPVTHFGTGDGVTSSASGDLGHPSALRGEDGRLYFATRKGVITIDPGLLPPSHDPVPVVVEQITADDHDITKQELAFLPPQTSHLAITFAGIHLSAPQRVEYRYMLQGFDQNWIEAGTRRTAYYTNIPPGKYRFLVSARSGAGVWSDAGNTDVAVGLTPHIYQTWWFRVLMVGALSLVVIGVYRLRLNAINGRFKAVAAERTRLAREIHDTLAQGFVAVSVRLELIARTMHPDRLDECRKELNETRTLVQEGLEEARRSIWNLRAQNEDQVTLPAHLDRIVKKTIEDGTDAELEVTGAYHAFSSAVEAELVRITQEAVSNALRHGDPSAIHIRLMYTRDMLRLEIIDDGAGFNPENRRDQRDGHYGLTGIRERSEHIGAELMIQSTPGSGTTIRIEIATQAKRRTSMRS